MTYICIPIVIKPYVTNCQTPEILSSILPPLIKHLDQKLVNEWNTLIEKGIQILPKEEMFVII